MQNAEPKISFQDALAVFQTPGNVDLVSPKSKSFVESLLSQFAKKGQLSGKQQYWLRVYAEKIVTPKASVAATVTELPAVGHALHKHLAAATAASKAKGGKWAPKIKFDKTDDHPAVQFKLAGPASKTPGAIFVTDGGSYQQSTYYGKIGADGVFYPANGCPQAVTDFVVLFAKDPINQGAVYGQKYGRCCFCAKTLTDPKSTSVGYGPVCADNFGLPWGEAHSQMVHGFDYAKAEQKVAAMLVKEEQAVSAEVKGHFHTPDIKPGMFVSGSKVGVFAQIAGADEDLADDVAPGGLQGAKSDLDLEQEMEAQPFQKSAAAASFKQAVAQVIKASDLGFSCADCMDTGARLDERGALVACKHGVE